MVRSAGSQSSQLCQVVNNGNLFNKSSNSKENIPSSNKMYHSGKSGLPSNTKRNGKTKNFQVENADCINVNKTKNCCAQNVQHFDQNEEENKNNSEEYYRSRSIVGQEMTHSSHSSKSTSLESAPRERKRWVRLPLLGQASHNEASTMMQDITSLGVNDNVKENDLQLSIQNELLQLSFTEKRQDYLDIKDAKPSGSLGEESEVSRKLKGFSKDKDLECSKFQESHDNVMSDNSVIESVQQQIYNMSISNQESSGTVIEATGSVRAPSPASVSSVTSSRRLEWDSGADVGYHNYQHVDGESAPNEGLSTIERIILARGCSAALRLEPESTSGSLKLLTAFKSKPASQDSKFVFKAPAAISTPIDRGLGSLVSPTTGTDSESEITPIVKLQAGRYVFKKEERNNLLVDEKNASAIQVHEHDRSEGNKEEVSCNILSKKLSSSLTNLSECGLNESYKNSLSRSKSCLNLLSKENYKNKAIFQYCNNGSFPLRHQQKKNNGLATCSASSSSIATVIPKHESPRMSDKVIQTSFLSAPMRHSVGIQVSEIEKYFEPVNTASYLTGEFEDDTQKFVGKWNVAQNTVVEVSDSDVIDKTESNIERNNKNTKHIVDSKPSSLMKQSGSHVSRIPLQSYIYHVRNHHKSQGNRKTCQSSALCKGAHKRGNSEHQQHLSATGTQEIVNVESVGQKEMFKCNGVQDVKGKSINESNEAQQNCVQQMNCSEEEITEKNSGTLESVTSSIQTTGSWFVDVHHSANGNQSGNCQSSSGVVGSANSFEYLPGHVYETGTAANVSDFCKNITEYSSSESISSRPSALFPNKKFETNNYKLSGPSASSTLARDLDKGVSQLKDLLNSKAYNSDMKKKLVRQVVNRLIETDYAEDSTLIQSLESNVPWVPSKSLINPGGFVSGYVLKSNLEDTVGEHKFGTMEREEISGESASKQQLNSYSKQLTNCKVKVPGNQSFYVADKCVGTGFSEMSTTSSPSDKMPLSDNRVDSRAETTTSTTGGCEDSSTSNARNGYSWKELTTQSEREYEQCKHKSEPHNKKSVLLNLCETERENQLSWICTEINHLKNLKQLLEKQRHLRRNLLSDAEEIRCKGYQKKKRNPGSFQKSSLASATNSEQGSLGSYATCTSSYSDRQSEYSDATSKTSIKPDQNSHIIRVLELKKSTVPATHNNIDESGLKTSQNVPDHNKTSSQKKHVFTQCPILVELHSNGSKGITKQECDMQHLKGKDRMAALELDSNASTNGDTFELNCGTLSDSTAAGRINVYVQTVNGQAAANKNSSPRPEVTDDKHARNHLESYESSENTMKYSKLSENNSLCCCECKKLLTKVSSEIKTKKQKSEKKLADSVNDVEKQNYAVPRGKIVQPKEIVPTRDSSSKHSALSSPETLENIIELTKDSDDFKKSSVGTENVGVQTTQSVSSLSLKRPQWYSMISPETDKLSKNEKKQTNLMKCPCCGTLESQKNVKSDDVSVQKIGYWKRTRSLKMKKIDRKCQTCGILESQVPKEEEILNRDITWKCHDCLMKESRNSKLSFNKCTHCGFQQSEYKEAAEQQEKVEPTNRIESLSTSSQNITPRFATKSSLGYILTVETTTDTVTSATKVTTKKPLEEIKIKVPVRYRHSVSSRDKKMRKGKTICPKPGEKFSSNENQKPIENTNNRCSDEVKLLGQKQLGKDLTLQEYLKVNRPDFIESAEYRQHCLDELAYLRELRQKSKQRLLALASHTTLFCGDSTSSRNAESLPPPPLAIKRVFSQQTMRAQTEQKYHNLGEVLNRKVEKKRKEDYRTNRLMAEIFARKLQKRVLKGEVNLSNSKSVISI